MAECLRRCDVASAARGRRGEDVGFARGGLGEGMPRAGAAWGRRGATVRPAWRRRCSRKERHLRQQLCDVLVDALGF